MRTMLPKQPRSARGSLLLAALAALACGVDLTPPPASTPETPGPVVGVAQPSYRWNTDASAIVTVRNPHDADVFHACIPVAIQRYRDGWRDIPSPFGGVECPPTRLAATDSLRLELPLTNDVIPQSGWYRVVFHLFRDAALQTPWDERSRVSPAFEVRP
jgi:hypothetical protein